MVDTDEAYEKANDFTSKLMPDFESKIIKYDEAIPLFTRYQIESQIETAYQREVSLPSGGSIVIDQTEALVAIDINSAKATGGSDIEETALNTNIESAVEIGKQLRLRDIGGLIVIDFIDMLSLKNKRAVEDKLWSALSIDRAKVQVGRISRFGLMEMSRQRLRPSLQERWTQDVASLSTAVLRLIEEESSKKNSGEVRAVVSSDMSIFLLNERRSRINEIEERTNTRVIVVSDPTRSDNRFEVSRLKSDDKKNKDSASYDIQSEIGTNGNSNKNYKKPRFEKAAVNLTPPKKPKKKGDGLLKKFLKLFDSNEESASKNKSKHKNQRNKRRPDNRNRRPQNRKPQSRQQNKAKDVTDNKKQDNTKDSKSNKEEPTQKRKSPPRKPRPAASKENKPVKAEKNVSEKDKKIESKSTSPKPRRNQKKDTTLESKTKTEEILETKAVDTKPEKKDLPPQKKRTEEKPKNEKQKLQPKLDTKDTKVKKENTSAVNEKTPEVKEEKIITEPKQDKEKAKDWGRASNDPRNKS